MSSIAFIFPGQGSQKVGMGLALAEAFPEARAAFDEADDAFDAEGPGAARLSTLCFEGPEEQLVLTEHTQPAILTVSVAAARVLAARGVVPDLVAGHSLGEYLGQRRRRSPGIRRRRAGGPAARPVHAGSGAGR